MMSSKKGRVKVSDMVENEKKTQSKSDVDTLCPGKRKVTIDGEDFIVERFAIEDMINLAREICEAVKSINETNPGLDFDKSSSSGVFALFMPEINRLIGILAVSIGKDKKWLMAKRDIEGFSNLVKAVCEINDFGVIIRNFQASWSLVKGQVAASAK